MLINTANMMFIVEFTVSKASIYVCFLFVCFCLFISMYLFVVVDCFCF